MSTHTLAAEGGPKDEAALEAALDAATTKQEVDAILRRLRPPFLYAIFEDARTFCLMRDERANLDSRWRRWLTAARLCWQADDYLGLLLYRARTALQAKGVPLLPRLLDLIDIALFSIRIGDHVVLKEGIYIPHGEIGVYGVTLIGRRAVLAPWCGIGTVQGSSWGPRIANDVFVGTGSKVLGKVRVGPNAVIGANAVVVEDVPARTTVAGVPARPRPQEQVDGAID